jgi:hypothetical protein
MAHKKISLARRIQCCPIFFKFLLTSQCLYIVKDKCIIHILDCVKIVYQLPLLPSNSTSETFIHRLGEVKCFDSITYLWGSTWYWTECFTIFISNRKLQQASYFHIFYLIAFLKEDFIRNVIIMLRINRNMPQCFSFCTCFSLLHLYIPNTVDTLSLASANGNYGKLLKGTIL